MKRKHQIPPQGVAAIVASVESRWNVTLAPARMIRHAHS